MREHLPETVKIQREILIRSNAPGGVLLNFKALLEALSCDKSTAPYMHNLYKQVEAENKRYGNKVREANEWIERCFDGLKRSKWVEDPTIKEYVKKAEFVILEKKYDPMEGVSFGRGYIDSAFDCLSEVAHRIVSFAEASLFTGWAEIEIRPMNGEMFIRRFIFPKSLEEIFFMHSKRGIAQKEERRSSDPVALLRFLLMLSKYGDFEPATIPPKNPITTWEDVEKYNHQVDVGYYLSRFSSNDPNQHPYGIDDLVRLIDTFLNMVSAHLAQKAFLKGPKKKNFEYTNAIEFAVREIKNYVRGADEAKRHSFKIKERYRHLHSLVDNCALGSPKKEILTKTLVEDAADIARKELKQEGIYWKIPSGRPLKSKLGVQSS